MSANRLFTLFIVVSLIAVIAFTAEMAFSSANSMDTESKEQAHQEYVLDERFGEIRGYIVEEDIASLSYTSRLNKCFEVPFSELANCRNALGERYSQTP
jgi:uncharacterized membrane protein